MAGPGKNPQDPDFGTYRIATIFPLGMSEEDILRNLRDIDISAKAAGIVYNVRRSTGPQSEQEAEFGFSDPLQCQIFSAILEDDESSLHMPAYILYLDQDAYPGVSLDDFAQLLSVLHYDAYCSQTENQYFLEFEDFEAYQAISGMDERGDLREMLCLAWEEPSMPPPSVPPEP